MTEAKTVATHLDLSVKDDCSSGEVDPVRYHSFKKLLLQVRSCTLILSLLIDQHLGMLL